MEVGLNENHSNLVVDLLLDVSQRNDLIETDSESLALGSAPPRNSRPETAFTAARSVRE